MPVVTRALILINALVFFYELALPEESLESLFYLFGIVPARFTDPGWANASGFPAGGYWVFLTHQFLHGGWLAVRNCADVELTHPAFREPKQQRQHHNI